MEALLALTETGRSSRRILVPRFHALASLVFLGRRSQPLRPAAPSIPRTLLRFYDQVLSVALQHSAQPPSYFQYPRAWLLFVSQRRLRRLNVEIISLLSFLLRPVSLIPTRAFWLFIYPAPLNSDWLDP